MKKSSCKEPRHTYVDLTHYLDALHEEHMRELNAIVKGSGFKRTVDQEEFDALIRRVSMLEKRVLK